MQEGRLPREEDSMDSMEWCKGLYLAQNIGGFAGIGDGVSSGSSRGRGRGRGGG